MRKRKINYKETEKMMQHDESICGGYKNCKDKTMDVNNNDCKECIDDYNGAMDDVNNGVYDL